MAKQGPMMFRYDPEITNSPTRGWKEFFNSATPPDGPYEPGPGEWLAETQTHAVVVRDGTGWWVMTICRRCDKPDFEYVFYGDGWPSDARCRQCT
jgi:hypothetical protein